MSDPCSGRTSHPGDIGGYRIKFCSSFGQGHLLVPQSSCTSLHETAAASTFRWRRGNVAVALAPPKNDSSPLLYFPRRVACACPNSGPMDDLNWPHGPHSLPTLLEAASWASLPASSKRKPFHAQNSPCAAGREAWLLLKAVHRPNKDQTRNLQGCALSPCALTMAFEALLAPPACGHHGADSARFPAWTKGATHSAGPHRCGDQRFRPQV